MVKVSISFRIPEVTFDSIASDVLRTLVLLHIRIKWKTVSSLKLQSLTLKLVHG